MKGADPLHGQSISLLDAYTMGACSPYTKIAKMIRWASFLTFSSIGVCNIVGKCMMFLCLMVDKEYKLI